MADTRTATPYDELAEYVAGLDMLAHTWSVEEILQGAPVDDPEDAQNVRSYVDLAGGLPRGRGAGPEQPAVVRRPRTVCPLRALERLTKRGAWSIW